MDNLKYLENWIDEYIKKEEEKYNENFTIEHKIKHIKRTAKMAEELNDNFMKVAMKFHDIGRFRQYELIGSFDDKIVSHYDTGIKVIDEEIRKGNLINSDELEIIKYVIMYHAGSKYYDLKLDESIINIIDNAAIIDNIDNGCVGALTYLEKEILNDSKHYHQNNPNLDMKSISNDVLNMYLNGDTFDKMKYVKTYADYLLFASSLAIKGLKSKYGFMAKKIMQDNNTLEGYKYLFNKYLDSNYSNICFECLEKYCLK